MRKLKIRFGKRLLAFAYVMLGFIAIALMFYSPEGFALMAAAPIIGLVKDGTFKELKPEEVAELSQEDQLKYFEQLNEFRAKNLHDLTEKMKKDNSDEIKQQIETLKQELLQSTKDELKAFTKIMKQQGEAIQKMQANGGGANAEKNQILTTIEKAKEGIQKAVDKAVKEFEFTIKANATRASVTNSTQAMRLQDIGQLARRQLTARDLFRVIPVSPASNGVVRYADWDEVTTVKAAAMVAEGGTFPESTAVWEEFKLDLKKLGDTIPVTEELVMDAPRFAAELDRFLELNIAVLEDTQLVTGDGTGNNLNGVYPTAPTYTPVASGIADASIYDLLVVMRAEITGPYGAKYMPDFAMMNIADILKMKLKKDANNNYVIPPFADRDGQMVDSLMVIENNAITANTLVLGDSRFGAIYEIEGYTASVGYTGDQFVQDLMTMKARKRENLLIRNVDQTGFLKCTSISAALTTLAT